MTKVVILMGVAGCGKTSVGKALAQEFGCPFFDADDYHPAANITRMAQGMPLTDEDRRPWLEALHALIAAQLAKGETAVLACSALKARYRRQLAGHDDRVVFVYLRGSFELIHHRMQARAGHYMKADMLRSQFEALEEPENALWVSVNRPVDEIVATVLQGLQAQLAQ